MVIRTAIVNGQPIRIAEHKGIKVKATSTLDAMKMLLSFIMLKEWTQRT